MGNASSGDAGRIKETKENEQGASRTKRKIDIWRSWLPKTDTSPRPESNGERLKRLSQQVQSAHHRIRTYRAILPQLGYTHESFTNHYYRSLEVEQKAWVAYTKKHSNRKQMIDHFEEINKEVFEVSQRIEAIEPDLQPARQGFERFRKSYETADENWQYFLTETNIGKELQAVYLGVKPLMSIYNDQIKTDVMAQAIKYYVEDDFTILDKRSSKKGIMIFSEKNVEKVFTAYPDYFPDYIPGSSLSSYLSHLDQLSETQTMEQLNIKRGLVHGFPLKASKQFAQYQPAVGRFIDFYEEGQLLSKEDKNLFDGYFTFLDESGATQYPINNKFKEDHQKEIGDLLSKYFPDMDEKARKYIVALRDIELPGFVYSSDNLISEEDRTLAQKVQDIFEISGMNDFLRKISHE